MAVAIGTASFTTLGAETASFTWLDSLLGTPVVFSSPPKIIFGPCQSVTSGGPGVPFLDGPGAITTVGGTVTMANPGTCTVGVTAIGT